MYQKDNGLQMIGVDILNVGRWLKNSMLKAAMKPLISNKHIGRTTFDIRVKRKPHDRLSSKIGFYEIKMSKYRNGFCIYHKISCSM